MELPELIFASVLGGIALWVVWKLAQARFVFVVRIRHGVARLAHGTLPHAYLQLIGEVCSEHSIQRGWVSGLRRGRRITLLFSRRIPPACRQRLRNQWALIV